MTDSVANPTFGDYVATQRLGSGGQATAWLAHHRDRPDEALLIKTFHIGVAEDWKTAELFERSARVLEQLDHPLIPSYRDHFRVELADSELLLCLVRDFVEGESLQDRLDAGKSFDEGEVIELTLRLLDALEYLHGLAPPVIHRDIKPANIVIDPLGQPYLVDFGAVQAEVMTETGGSTIVGTAGYVAPEQLMGRAQPPSDLYALGVTILYLVSGLPPTSLPSDGFELELPANLEVSPGLRHVIRRMTRADIDVREESIDRLRRHLNNLERGLELVVGASTLPVKVPEGSRLQVLQADDELSVFVPRKLTAILGSSAAQKLRLGGGAAWVAFLIVTALLAGEVILPVAIALGVGIIVLMVAMELKYVENEIELTLSNDKFWLAHPRRLHEPVRDMVHMRQTYKTVDHLRSIRQFSYADIDEVYIARWDTDDALALVIETNNGQGTRRFATAARLSHGEHIWIVRLLEARLEQWRELNPDQS